MQIFDKAKPSVRVGEERHGSLNHRVLLDTTIYRELSPLISVPSCIERHSYPSKAVYT